MNSCRMCYKPPFLCHICDSYDYVTCFGCLRILIFPLKSFDTIVAETATAFDAF